MKRRKTKRSSRRNAGPGTEEKYKAFNAFLMLVILLFVLFFIAQMPKHERATKTQATPAISPTAQAPKPVITPSPQKPVAVTAPKQSAPQKPPAESAKKQIPLATKASAAPAKKAVNFAKTKTLPLKTTPVAAARPIRPPATPTIPKPAPAKLRPPERTLPPQTTTPSSPRQLKGKIAIVLDDWGYRAGSPDSLNARLYPITAAVIPNLAHTRSVVEQLHKNGYEIILHLPMEPMEKMNLEPDTITVDLKESQIRKIVGQDLSEITYAKGINNHMGSRATSDMRAMVPVFKELRRSKLYFLDSYTSTNSVCEGLAHKLKVPFVKRDVFIDNESSPEYIRGQIAKLKSLASVRGWAIGIGHDRKNTLEVLKEELPKIRNEGYELVYLSELTQ